jgi:hypothetical protein
MALDDVRGGPEPALAATPGSPSIVRALLGSAPSAPAGFWGNIKIAALRAARTFLQGVAAAIPTGAAATQIFDAGFGKGFLVALLGAALTAIASFLHNAAGFLPEDPTQTTPGK